MDQYLSYVNPRTNMRGFVIAILVIALLGFTVGGAALTNREIDEDEMQSERENDNFSAPFALVYGKWSGNQSEIRLHNLANGNDILLADLSTNIKHVRLISSSEIAYIDETDGDDYGSKISIRDTTTNQNRIVVSASPDVRIDDYRISPSGQYIATWEVSKPQGSVQLYGGISRVYVTNVISGEKKQIVSEVATSPVHYPIGITNNGRVFMDSFLPNDGVGWAYGMSYADFSNPQPQNISSMTNGTYGSQPNMSSDGSKIIFAGYDGSRGDGDAVVGGFRRSVISTNTIETLDTNTLTRSRILASQDTESIRDVWWDDVSERIVYSQISSLAEESGTYVLNNNLGEKINIKESNSLNFASVLMPESTGISIVGKITTDDSTAGNLGPKYSQLFEKIYVMKSNGDEVTSLNLPSGFIQPIAVKNSSFFSDIASISSENDSIDTIANSKQLQFQAFTIKPNLLPEREDQQSEPTLPEQEPSLPGEQEQPVTRINLPKCKAAILAACNEVLGSTYSKADYLKVITSHPGDYVPPELAPLLNCVRDGLKGYDLQCIDSPLYLYGDNGTEVNVKVGTPIYDMNVAYTPIMGFNLKLDDGKMNDGASRVDSIDFDYQPAHATYSPSYGFYIESSQAESTFRQFAKELGFNQKETIDTVKKAKELIGEGNAFVSYYPDEISKKILPLYFSPMPNNYHNTVFYVKRVDELEKKGLVGQFPDQSKIKRTGFTAVEISFKVE